MKVLRTPDERFANLPDFDYEPRYTVVPRGDGEGEGIRIHHVEAGPADGPLVLLMHGQPTWSFLYRRMIPVLVERGMRVMAPDLVGYGRSDKPTEREDYTYQRQVDWLGGWLRSNGVEHATLVGQDWGGLIGLRLVADDPARFDRVVAANTGLPLPMNVPQETVEKIAKFRAEAPTPTIMEMQQQISQMDAETSDRPKTGVRTVTRLARGRASRVPAMKFAYWQKWTWETEDIPVGMLLAGSVDGVTLTPEEIAAYDAPFPDPSYKAGIRAMPSRVPMLPTDPSVPAQIEAWKVFSEWTRPFLCAFADNDPVTGAARRPFEERVPGAKGQSHRTIEGGGHFLQEGRGVELATIVADFIDSTPAEG